MKRKILISILCCLLLALGAGLAQAAPSVKISGNNITIEEGVTDSILAEIKAAGVKNPNFALKKISSTEDLAKICSQYPDMTELNLEGTKDLTSIEPLAGLKKLKQIVLPTPRSGSVNAKRKRVCNNAARVSCNLRGNKQDVICA